MKSGAFGVSAKDGENSVDVLAPLLDELTGEYIGKLHLSVPGTGKVFCGLNHSLFYINAGNLDWVMQSDPDKQICLRCKRAAENYLKKTGAHQASI
ncbi:hypothetical protein FXE84_01065 [Vibrio cholerae]|uniref:hypothetical protein n=1 Tax=Vibrio cholerae TaxID=666 RepID=UPI0004E3C22F|nr:hypothetical protein [Vibrio cholerae]KFE29013.1 hypothetical protein DN30_387 [Vibrio cholerae]TXY43956.1 hypothetical protein FXE84_01065 [Vibrio cholerae]HAS5778523.1 hypothetical protein [Vibrio cholerae]HDI3250074.1 hypothetical protein [Vibrio cholerae]